MNLRLLFLVVTMLIVLPVVTAQALPAHSWIINGTDTNSSIFDYMTETTYNVNIDGSVGWFPNISNGSALLDPENNWSWERPMNTTNGGISHNAYIDYGSRYFDETSGNWSIEMWWKAPDDYDNDSVLTSTLFTGGAPGAIRIWFYYQYSNKTFHLEAGTSLTNYIEYSPVVFDESFNESWVHMGISARTEGNATNYTMCMNGTNQTQMQLPNQSTADLPVSNIRLGGGQGNLFAVGSIDEIRIWNTTRSCAEMAADMFTSYYAPAFPNRSDINITVFDEDTNIPFGSGDFNLRYMLTGPNTSLNVTTADGNLTVPGLTSGTYHLRINEINESNYNARTRFITHNALTNTSTAVRFYMLNTTVTSVATLISLVDETGVAIENATINSQREFIDHGFLGVESALTDNQGEVAMYFHTVSVPYAFDITLNGTSICFVEAKTVKSGAVKIRCELLADPYSKLRTFANVSSSLITSNETGEINYTFFDPTGEVILTTFKVIRFGSPEKQEVCSQTFTASSGTGNCVVPNITGEDFLITTCHKFSESDELECDTQEFTNGSKTNLQRMGLFILVLLFIAFVFGVGFQRKPIVILGLVTVFVAVIAISGLFGVWGYTLAIGMLVMFLIALYVVGGT